MAMVAQFPKVTGGYVFLAGKEVIGVSTGVAGRLGCGAWLVCRLHACQEQGQQVCSCAVNWAAASPPTRLRLFLSACRRQRLHVLRRVVERRAGGLPHPP